jgi:uncharacterized membrane protein (DUF2068 family)
MKGSHRGFVGLEIIGAFKLLKAVLLIVGAVLLPIVGKGHMDALFWLLRHLSVDPHAHYFQELVRKLIDLSPKFPLISVGMFCYGVIFSVEGIGLLLRKHWAEYLTVIVTASFLPLEVYELIHHTTAVKGFVIALNVAIVVYLVLRLKLSHKARQHSSAKRAGVPNGRRERKMTVN